jgi:hypothetical protein
MHGSRRLAVGFAAAFAGCGGGGGGSGSPSTVVAVLGPAEDVDVSRGAVVDVSYRCDDTRADARTKIVLDRDGDLGTTADALVVASDLPETGAGAGAVSWDTTGVSPGVFTVFAVATRGDGSESAAKGDGLVTVSNVAFAQETPTAQVRNVASLPDGSCVVVGTFVGSATFGAGEPGQTTLLAAGGADDLDVFLARFRRDGTLAWARRAGGPEAERCDALAVAESGEFVVAGLFLSSATFGAGEPGEKTLQSGGPGSSAFVAAFTADGRLRWATHAEGNVIPVALALFDGGSCALTGNFLATATFGPGESGETSLSAADGGGPV